MKRLGIFLLALLCTSSALLTACSSPDDAQVTDTDSTVISDTPQSQEPETTTEKETTKVETTTAKTTPAATTKAPEPKPVSRVNPKDPDFFILYTTGEVDFTNAPKAYVDIYKWGDEYTPKVYAQMVFKEGDGLYVRMECEETNPRAENTEYNSPVYHDSCMEFFCIYKPELVNNKYINFEMNAASTYLSNYNDRNPGGKTVAIKDLTDTMPTMESFKTDTTWGINLHVPNDTIDDIYGGKSLTEGSKLLLNLYKCGDKTEIKHYGSWAEIDNPKPNFHLPQFFCEVEIRKP